MTVATLYLPRLPRIWFIAARDSSENRLFISAFTIASKVICDAAWMRNTLTKGSLVSS